MRHVSGVIAPAAPLAAARARLEALEMQIRRVDARLASASTEGLERERTRFEREYDRLSEAVEFAEEVLPALVTCACGKICHVTRASAEAHMRALETLAPPPPARGLVARTRRVERARAAYLCPRALGEGVWHVGHRVKDY